MEWRATACFLLAGCYDAQQIRLTRFDAPGCHIQALAVAPTDARAIKVARIRVFADMRRIDENWAFEELVGIACTYGANALLLLDEKEALPTETAPDLKADYASFVAEAFKLPPQ